MATPSATLSPISNANDWMTFTLSGIASPGTIALGGMKGFKRETGWDIKKGKGTQGATLTLKEIPPVEGKITLNLIDDADFAAWDNFVAKVLSINPKQQQAQGLDVYHPSFSSIGLTTVVVKHYTAPEEYGGKRRYQVEIDLLEWQPPPPVSVVATPTGTAPEQPGGTTPIPPAKAAKYAQVALLNNAIAAAKAP